MANDRSSSRRWFLTGVLGSSLLAGCNSSPSESTPTAEPTTEGELTTEGGATSSEATTAEPTTDSESSVEHHLSVSLETTVSEEVPQLAVTGQGSHPGGIDRVDVSFGTGETVELDREEPAEAEFDVQRTVPGGQRFGVDVTLVPAQGASITRRVLSDYVTEPRLGDETDSMVVANYYPWYGPDRHEVFVDESVLSEYDSRDEAVIEQHVDWATEYGVDAFCASWWGQDSWEDETMLEQYLPAEATDGVEFCLLYETKSLLDRAEDGTTDFDDESVRRQFVDDVAYMAEHYLGEDTYLRVDGKPLVYMYSAMHFEGDLEAAFAEAEAAAGEELFIVLEIVDWRFPRPRDRELMAAADGVTAYEMYRSIDDINENFAERMAAYYPEWLLAAKETDCVFMPMVMPGFSKRKVTGDEDRPIVERSRERMQRVCELSQQYIDPAVDTSFVTSWNEWHEHTQVEPSVEHGTSDLEVIRDTISQDEFDYWLTDTVGITLTFDETVEESVLTGEDIPPKDDRDLALALETMTFEDDSGAAVDSYDLGVEGEEPYFTGGVFAQASSEEKSWRWLGGENGAVTFVFDEAVLEASTLTLRGFPATDGLSGTLSVGGLELGSIDFGERRSQSYSFDLL